jgi:hypothetical protein
VRHARSDAEAERRIARILLHDTHVDVGPATLRQMREEKTGGSGARDADAHQSLRASFERPRANAVLFARPSRCIA